MAPVTRQQYNKRVAKESSDSDNYSETKTVSHKSLPSYAPFTTYYSPDLAREKYKPRDLMNYAVRAFYARDVDDLNPRQQDSRNKFVQIFNNRKDQYGHVVDDAHLASLQRDMQSFMEYLDGFFFFGYLQLFVKLDTGMNQISQSDPYTGQTWESSAVRCREGDKDFIRIQLNLERHHRIHDLQTLVGNLVHEMIHAWFFHFSCVCARCHKDLLNTTGHPNDHHGPIFIMLHRLIVTEIRRWDPALEDFLADDCPNDYVSQSALRSFQLSTAGLGESEKKEYNSIRKVRTTTRNLIRLTANDKVAVLPQLKHRPLRIEDNLRIKILRKKEEVKDTIIYNKILEQEVEHSEGTRNGIDDNSGESDEQMDR
ncbi:hypothetical protein F5Y19DRAFT_476833 [Xylariaceae sp. FL1651]|nr:hypothetical protein F5Y19DRAFT_476833 [Xylariaceae sp. FL1651]